MVLPAGISPATSGYPEYLCRLDRIAFTFSGKALSINLEALTGIGDRFSVSRYRFLVIGHCFWVNAELLHPGGRRQTRTSDRVMALCFDPGRREEFTPHLIYGFEGDLTALLSLFTGVCGDRLTGYTTWHGQFSFNISLHFAFYQSRVIRVFAQQPE